MTVRALAAPATKTDGGGSAGSQTLRSAVVGIIAGLAVFAAVFAIRAPSGPPGAGPTDPPFVTELPPTAASVHPPDTTVSAQATPSLKISSTSIPTSTRATTTEVPPTTPAAVSDGAEHQTQPPPFEEVTLRPTVGPPPAPGSRIWRGVECMAADARPIHFVPVVPCPEQSASRREAASSRKSTGGATSNCSLPMDPLPPGSSLGCTFWSRTVRSAPLAASAFRDAQLRLAAIVFDAEKDGGLCSLADLDRSLMNDTGNKPNQQAGFVRVMRSGVPRYELRVDGCVLPTGLLEDPVALLHVLRSASDGGRRPIVFSGDSVTRQLFVRLVASVRGRPTSAPAQKDLAPLRWGAPWSLECWCDLVYVARQLTDEVSVVKDGATHYPREGARRPDRDYQATPDSQCWTTSGAAVDPPPTRPAIPDPGTDHVCVRSARETEGAAWCDPEDQEDPCFLRLHFVWSAHEGFAIDDDYARHRFGVFTKRGLRPNSGVMDRNGTNATRCRVDCPAGRKLTPTMPKSHRASVQNVVGNDATVHGPPLSLPYTDIPSLHVASNNYWAGFTVTPRQRDRGVAFFAKMTNTFIGRFWSYRSRLWRNDLCSNEAQQSAKCPAAPPPMDLIWLTTPRVRSAKGENVAAPRLRDRNQRMKIALREDWDPVTYATRRKAGSMENDTLAAIDAVHDDASRYQRPQRRWAFLADLAGMTETIPANGGPRGKDDLHWMCVYHPPSSTADTGPVLPDNTGCIGDVDGGQLLYVVSMMWRIAEELRNVSVTSTGPGRA